MKKLLNVKQIYLIVLLILCIALTAILAVGCGKKTEEAPETQAKPVSEKPAETEAFEPAVEIPEVKGPEFTNPLTGLEADRNLSGKRPAAIMINNIRVACPQEGISNADILYEALAEGGITRMLMVVSDYEKLGQTGSVRSSREYYIDFAQNHDALYFHAGGSDGAYAQLASRKIDHFDGVRTNVPNCFYRDQWRMNNMGYEHSMMVTGPNMVNAVAYKNSRTDIKQGFENPMKFVKYGTVDKLENGSSATCVYLPFSNYQSQAYLQYNAETNTYLRYQYGGPQVDKQAENKQLEFTNVLVVLCPHKALNDAKNHISITTTGSGAGYYISGGKYVEITWKKAGQDDPIQYFNTDGSPLEINRGKTYVAVFDVANKNLIQMDYQPK